MHPNFLQAPSVGLPPRPSVDEHHGGKNGVLAVDDGFRVGDSTAIAFSDCLNLIIYTGH